MIKSNIELKAGEKILYEGYVHWSNWQENGKNYLVGMFSIRVSIAAEIFYTFEYFDEALKIAQDKGFDWCSGCNPNKGRRK